MKVFGLGTGRCGTLSLSRFFAANGLTVPHEKRPLLRWDQTTSVRGRWDNIDGEVSLSLLRYYDKLPKDCRIIYLDRPYGEVMFSYARHIPKGNSVAWHPVYPHPFNDFYRDTDFFIRWCRQKALELTDDRWLWVPTKDLNCMSETIMKHCFMDGVAVMERHNKS